MRIRLAIAVLVAGLSVSAAVYAAPADNPMPTHAMFSKSKIVKMALQNESGSPVELKVGDQVVSLGAGKTVSMKLAVGTRIVASTATPKHQPGDLLVEVSDTLQDATLIIR